ncbi:MAG: hypothetical protein A2Z21_10585 [Candidatus Fraserbacteria bacterium RBG_16_55_9]|uniref:Uncharacterized protein n=1 Tax=Fraserbacteria sp. (strain RBG_16_55_9) TaxID=1817864 RepID=A0A1F5UQ94_FRAXR|nr:MAG: hypothetical protein A2Z21_10585 [Candidatus Fraserbacteria bacterium RBG_16_55_9]
MRDILGVLLGVAIIISIALLITRGNAEVTAQREQLESKIEDLLQREEVALTDFIKAFGEPQSLGVVTCQGENCLKASWDLSYSTRVCWKRLSVVLNEQKKNVFFAELKDLVVIERKGEDTRCAEAPE